MDFNCILIGSENPGALVAALADPDDNYFQLMSPMGPPEA